MITTALKYVIYQQSANAWLGQNWPSDGVRVKRLAEAGRFTKAELDDSDKFRPNWWNNDDLTAMLAPEFGTADARYMIVDDDGENDTAYLTGFNGADVIEDGEWSWEWNSQIDSAQLFTLDQAQRLMKIAKVDDNNHDTFPDTANIVLAVSYLPQQLPKHKRPRLDPAEYEDYNPIALGKASLDIFAAAEKAANEATNVGETDKADAIMDEAAKVVVADKLASEFAKLMAEPIKVEATNLEEWVDDIGLKWMVHAESVCVKPCGIHAPSFHSLSSAPRTMGAFDYGNGNLLTLMRKCEHEVWHPDADDKNVEGAPWLIKHDCCAEKCCWSDEMREG